MAQTIPTAEDASLLTLPTPDDHPPVEEMDSDEARTHRARTDRMVVVPHVDPQGYSVGMYDVFTASRSHYIVDLKDRPKCDCKDFQFNDAVCKHIRRCSLATAETSLPAPDEDGADYFADLADLHERLEQHYAGLLDTLDTVEHLLSAADHDCVE